MQNVRRYNGSFTIPFQNTLIHIRQTISAAKFIPRFPAFCSKLVKYGGFIIKVLSFIGIHVAKNLFVQPKRKILSLSSWGISIDVVWRS